MTDHFRLSGRLRAMTGVRVGGIGGEPGLDLGLAEDGQGRLVIPGTSLAGALRAWTEQAMADCVPLWGDASAEGRASAVSVEDGLVDLDRSAREMRDGVGIDRYAGAAAAQVRYTLAVLPRGTAVAFDMSVEVAPEADAAVRRWLSALIAALRTDGLTLGAARSGGLGRMVLEGPAGESEPALWLASERDRRSLLNVLRSGGEPVALSTLGAHAAPTRQVLRVEVAWAAELPLLAAAGHQGRSLDALPRVTPAGDGQVAFLLPGRSVKGVLRAHAERIVRTVLEQDVEPGSRFLDQVRVPLVADVFGSPDRRGALAVGDCCSLERVGADLWRAVEEAPDLRLAAQALRRTGLAEAVPAMHVAVDRWTGAAAERRLFSAVEIHGVSWEPIRIDVDLGRLLGPALPDTAEAQGRAAAGMALLFLVLQDLGEGRLTFGGAGNRGHGQVSVSGISCTGHGQCPIDAVRALPDPLRWAPGGGFPAEVRRALGAAWSRWLAGQRPGGVA